MKYPFIFGVLLLTAISVVGCKKHEACEYSRAVHYIRPLHITPVNFSIEDMAGYELITFNGGTNLTDTISHYRNTGELDSFFQFDSLMFTYYLWTDSITWIPTSFGNIQSYKDYVLYFPVLDKRYVITGAQDGEPLHKWIERCNPSPSPGYRESIVTTPVNVCVDNEPVTVFQMYSGPLGSSFHVFIYK